MEARLVRELRPTPLHLSTVGMAWWRLYRNILIEFYSWYVQSGGTSGET